MPMLSRSGLFIGHNANIVDDRRADSHMLVTRDRRTYTGLDRFGDSNETTG
jgi:hypothetical protein